MNQGSLPSSPTVSDPFNNGVDIPVAQVLEMPDVQLEETPSRSVQYFNETIIIAQVDGIVDEQFEATPTVHPGHMVASSLTGEQKLRDKLIIIIVSITSLVVIAMNILFRSTDKETISSAPTLHPSAFLFPSNSPSNPTISPTTTLTPWKIISPQEGFYSQSDGISFPFSVSLSYDGNKLAILHRNGIVSWEKINSNEWVQYGTDITPEKLIVDSNLSWEKIIDKDLISTDITLSSDGRKILWNIHYSKGDGSTEGLAVLYRFSNAGSMANKWTRISEVFQMDTKVGNPEYQSSVAFARVSADSFFYPDDNVFPQWGVVSKLSFDQSWDESAYLSPSIDLSDTGFGSSSSISGEGNVVAISSPFSSRTLDGLHEGKVQIFSIRRNSLWELKGSELWGTFINNNFGIVSLSSSGNEVAVGTPNVGRGRPGQVWVYRYSDSLSDWVRIEYFEGNSPSEYFGQMISLAPDGNAVAIAAPRGGRVCVYKEDLSDFAKRWSLQGRCIDLKQDKDIDPWKDNYLDFSISLSANANSLTVGIPSQNRLGISGDVKVYEFLPR